MVACFLLLLLVSTTTNNPRLRSTTTTAHPPRPFNSGSPWPQASGPTKKPVKISYSPLDGTSFQKFSWLTHQWHRPSLSELAPDFFSDPIMLQSYRQYSSSTIHLNRNPMIPPRAWLSVCLLPKRSRPFLRRTQKTRSKTLDFAQPTVTKPREKNAGACVPRARKSSGT